MENIKSLKENKGVKTGQIIRIEQEQLTKHLDKVVRGTVEETLNALLELRQTNCVRQAAMSGQRSVRIHGQGIISGNWTQKPAKLN